MFKSNLIELMRKLDPKEFRELGEYVRSPFFNKNEGVIKLYDYISKQYPELEEKVLKKEDVFGKLFPGTAYNEGFMKTIMFNLTRLTEDYFGYLNYRNKTDTLSQEYSIIDELFNRGLDKVFLKKLKQAEDKLDKAKNKDPFYFSDKYRLQFLKEQYLNIHQRFLNYKDVPDEDTYKSIEYLLEYFFLKILGHHRFMYNMNKLVKFNFRNRFLDEVVEYLQRNENQFSPQVLLHLYELLLLKENDEKYYYKTKELLRKEINNIRKGIKYSTISILFNYASEQYYEGKQKFLSEMFELNKIITEYELYTPLEDGFFNEVKFKNAVEVGIQMKEYNWTETFIKDYKDLLHPDEKNIAANYAYSQLNFAREKYEKALGLINAGNISNVKYKVSIKNLTLKLYYELGWLTEAFDLVDSNRHFLSHDKVLPEHSKKMSINFLKFYNKLLKLKSNGKPLGIRNLKAELMRANNLYERDWLQEKLNELIS